MNVPRNPSKKRTKKRWFMLFLLFILTAINYLDRHEYGRCRTEYEC